MKLTSKIFPGFSRVHLLFDAGSNSVFRGDILLDPDEPFAVTRAEVRPRSAVIRWAMGRRQPKHIIFTTYAAPLILHSRMIDLMKASGFTGWETYPVEVFGKDGEAIPDYHGLAVHGRCGAIDNSMSVKVDRIFPGGVFPVWKGLMFDPATWDGSDFFMPAGRNARIFVVDDVRRAFENAKVPGDPFTPLTEIERREVEMSMPTS